MSSPSFIDAPTATPEAQALFDADEADRGFVMNLSRVWAHQPATRQGFVDLQGQCVQAGALTLRQRAIIVTACASTLGDSYCSLAWGATLVQEADAEITAAVLRGDDGPLDDAERALARWVRQMVRDPNATTAADVQSLRDAGFEDAQIFALTVFAGLRLAFSTINGALGVQPDPGLIPALPPEVRDAVTYGRPVTAPTP